MQEGCTEAQIRLLLVEDDAESGEALRSMLEKRGVTTRMATTADEGFRAFKEGPFDIVVADIRLRGKSGVDLLGDIRADNPDFPVILLTGFDSLESAIQAVRLGAQDYILKPLDDVGDLLRPARKAVERHRLVLRNRALEQELRESEARFRAVLENSSDVIYRLNIADEAFDYVSPSVTAVVGDTAEEVRSMSMAQLAERIHPDDREMLGGLAREVKARRGKDTALKPLECRIRTRDNDYRWIGVANTLLFDPSGQPVAVVGAARNISAQKQAETRERELNERLERVKRVELLSVAAAGIAHDLNNVLSPIMGYPEMILDALAKGGNTTEMESVRSDLLSIRDSAITAVGIIRNMLTLGRRGIYYPLSTNLNEIVEEYLRSLTFRRLSAAHPKVLIDRDQAANIAPIRGSKPHLLPVIMNLVANAYDAVGEVGRIAIKTANESLTTEVTGYETIGKGEYVVLRVADTGVGIAAEDLYRIFEPFYSGKSMTQDSGTGLGLAVVHGVVKDLGGFVDVRSAKDRGTEFALFFPAMRGPVEGGGAVASLGGHERILLFDNKAERLSLTQQHLKKLGYTVTVASNWADVLHVLTGAVSEPDGEDATSGFDLIVVDDIRDETGGGVHVCRRILKIFPDQTTLVVTNTAPAGGNESEGTPDLIARLERPFTLDEFAGAIRRELDKRKKRRVGGTGGREAEAKV